MNWPTNIIGFYGVTFPSTGIHSPAFRDATFRYALHYRAISTSASFILLLFIYRKFHMTDGRNRSPFFLGSNACPLLFPFFCFCPLLLLPPLNHSKDKSKCNRTFTILLSVTGRSKGIPNDQPTSRILLSREQVLGIIISASSTSLPYSIAHTTKNMRCDIRSLNPYMPSEVSTEIDLLFDRSSTFESCGTSRIV